MKIKFKKVSIKPLVSKNTKLKHSWVKIFNLFKAPDVIDSNDVYRTLLLIINRQSNLIGFLSIICLCLIFLIALAYPLKEKVPYFLTFLPKDEQITYVEPYRKTISQQRVEKEHLARMYVKMRETIDLVTDYERYSNLIFYSTEEIGNSFTNYMSTERNPNSPYKYAIDNNILSSVDIISSNMLNNDQYQVNFLLIKSDKLTRKEIETTEYIATVSFVNPSNSFKGESYLINPLGYKVSNYQVSLKATKIHSNIKKTRSPFAGENENN